jgi:hypothetical protein
MVHDGIQGWVIILTALNVRALVLEQDSAFARS